MSDAAPPKAPTRGVSVRGALLAALVITVVAAMLRLPVSSVPPLLDDVAQALGLSSTSASLLVTAPVLCLAVVGPLAPRLARRLSLERVVIGALAGVVIGVFLRSAGGMAALFAGTIVLGACIGLAQVMLPGLVKRDFARHAGLMTGVYNFAMSLGATVAAALAVPTAAMLGGGWQAGLMFWAVPITVGSLALAWVLRDVPGGGVPAPGPAVAHVGVWRSARAWDLAAFAAIQLLAYWALFSWLPTIYREGGFAAGEAGWLLGFAQLVATPSCLIVPLLAARSRDQRGWVAAVTAVTAVGLVGLAVDPMAAPYLWASAIGVGLGGGFPLGLTLVVLRATSTEEAVSVSAMTQTVAYVCGPAGPFMLGALHDLAGSWSAGAAALTLLLLLQLVAGWRAASPGRSG